MLIRPSGFNLYLILALLSATACGCKTGESKDKKVFSTLRLHLEAKADPMGRTESAEVYRQSPIRFTIEKNPFLTEGNVKQAKVIDVTGGFALEIQFDRQGTWLLEQYTTGNRTKHILVACQFVAPGQEKKGAARWLAAPQINNHISDGTFIFTPDASREEAERIALGLNNVAKRLETGKELK